MIDFKDLDRSECKPGMLACNKCCASRACVPSGAVLDPATHPKAAEAVARQQPRGSALVHPPYRLSAIHGRDAAGE